MASRPLVTVVGATGAQGGAVVRSLLATDKYKIRGLTRDATSKKAQALKDLGNDIEVVTCNINKVDDVKRAFQDSWAIFALTDFWAQPHQPEVEIQQGKIMADVAASLQTPYYIFSVLEDTNKLSNGKYDVPEFSQKAHLRDYIKEEHPTLKAIYVEPAVYMQNWQSYFKTWKLDDGSIVFPCFLSQNANLHIVDIDDTGPIVREILNSPEKYVGQDICICGDVISFADMSKIFTKVTGLPAISKTLTEDELRVLLGSMPKTVVDELMVMLSWIEEFGFYGREKDWTTGRKVTKLNTFEDWLRKTGWKGE